MRILRSGIVLAVMGLGLSLGTLSTSAQTDDGRYYPVVQIISYDMLHGTYPEMLGWGSASVVDDSGLLVSNNHVVVDGQDKEVDAFSICVTTSRAERPDCRFTAHVLDRDSTKDLSVLRIDPTDIFGEPVDFSLFRSLEIADDSELPDNLSSVTAVGYPWIGADTVSETTGIVSGTIEYNNAKYIKSDATIAGGNSGGALLDADGRLVGIPTFTIGYDTSLGYALWIGEARDFIENAAKNEATQKDSDTAFRENRRIVEWANDNGYINDSFVSVSYPSNYETQVYIERTRLQIVSTGKNESDLSSVTIDFISTPKVDEERFLYLLESQGFYSRSYHKLKKRVIGEKTFYEAIPKSGPNYSSSKILIGRINDHVTAVMNIQAAFYDSTLQDTYEAEYARFLQNVVFYDSPKPALPLRMPELGLTLSSSDSLAYSAYYGFITGFFGNLHESFNLSISEFDDQFDSFEEFADYRDSYSYGGKPTRIKLGTIDGLIECSGYAYFPMDRDENGNILPEMTNCSILLYKVESGPVPHTVSVSITSEKRNIEKNIDRTYAALGRMFKQEVDISSIPNPARQITVYSDIADQSIEYNSRIAWLVDHGLLPKKSMLLPMQAVTWGEFLDMYVRFMYGVEYSEEAAKCTPGDYGCRFATIDLATLYPERKPDEGNAKKTLQDVFASLEIEYNQPVEAYFDSSLEQVLLLEIAGVDTSKISFQDMWDLWNETEQSAEFNIRIQEVENAIYRGERVSSYQVFSGYATYTTNCYLYQNSAGLIRKDCSGNTNKVRFNATESARKSLSAVDAYKTRISIIDSPVCTMGSAEYSTDSCLAALNENEKKRLEETVEYMDAHWILSRAGAIDWFLDRMDFSLFDESLAKNKNTDLETEEIEEAKESEEEAANG